MKETEQNSVSFCFRNSEVLTYFSDSYGP